MRAVAALLSLLVVASLAALVQPGPGTAAAPQPAVQATLRLTVKGLPTGRAAVTVTGPRSYRRTVTGSTVLRRLRPGSYTVTAADVPVTGGKAVPTVRRKTLRLAAGYTTSYTVTYVKRLTPVTGPEIVGNNLDGGTVGVPYSETLTATGTGVDRAMWSWAGNRPPGLSLAPNGALTGTPTSTGTYFFDATVTVDGRSDTEGVSVTVRPPPPPDEPETWTSVTAGIANVCGIKTDGTAWCWGWGGRSGSYYALGNGSLDDSGYPVRVSGDGTWKTLDVNGFACGIKADDTAWCWGVNNYGELGNGTTTSPIAPTQVLGGGSWRSLSTGYAKACGVKTDGTAWCWGAGDLGTGAEEGGALSPVQVQGDAEWTEVSVGSPGGQAGSDHVCLVEQDESVWCFGENFYGAVGNGGDPQVPVRVPVPIDAEQGFAAVDSGGRHTCAVDTEADLWCWGHNVTGQVGVPFGGSRVPSPVEIDTETWRSVDGGDQHTCGVRNDDTGWCWGANDYLQLGPASSASSEPSPVQVPGSWVRLDSGDFTTCGIATETSYAYCWGTSFAGGLGDATTTTSATPVLVLG